MPLSLLFNQRINTMAMTTVNTTVITMMKIRGRPILKRMGTDTAWGGWGGLY